MKYIYLILMALMPLCGLPQSNFDLDGNSLILEKKFRSKGKTQDQIHDIAKKAIYEEFKITKAIIVDDKDMGYILANGKSGYSNSGFNKADREVEFNVSINIDGDAYTIKFFDFIGRFKRRANFQFDYAKEYRSLYVLESSSKRSARRKQFEAFESAIMTSMSNITSKIGVTEVIN